MPELRKGPVVGRWVIIANERARRPGNFIDRSYRTAGNAEDECAFCGPRPDVIYSPGDGVSVVPADGVASGAPGEFHRTRHGLYEVIDGLGAHEIVIETPDHVGNMADLETGRIRRVMETYADRMRSFEGNRQIQYAAVYKNYGPVAGGRNIAHTRSHVVATPVRPLRVKEKLMGAKAYFDANHRCAYCDMIRQESESRKRVVCETEHFIAIVPFAAQFLFELRVIPKKHHCDFHEGVRGTEEDLAVMMKGLLRKFKEDLDNPAYNFVIQTAPFRRSRISLAPSTTEKWKTIAEDYHWHIELMPRLTCMAGFEKGTGFSICAIPPEDMAEYLRGGVACPS